MNSAFLPESYTYGRTALSAVRAAILASVGFMNRIGFEDILVLEERRRRQRKNLRSSHSNERRYRTAAKNLKPRRIKTGAAVIMRMGWTILILRVREIPHEVELRVNVREPYRTALQETTEPLGMA